MPLPPLKITDSGFTYCHDLLGHPVCTGAKQGLPNYLPADPHAPLKLRLVQVRLSADGYAPNGAYFGAAEGSRLYHAESTEEAELSQESWWTENDPPRRRTARLFLKAANRLEAKTMVRNKLPNASFYR